MDILALPRLIWELLVYVVLVMPDLLPIILALATDRAWRVWDSGERRAW